MRIGPLNGLELLIIVILVVPVILFWRIFSKAGYPGALSLMMLFPPGILVALCILAFGEWPVYRKTTTDNS